MLVQGDLPGPRNALPKTLDEAATMFEKAFIASLVSDD